tara:strand:- start:1689 stop:2516 length:828 start_codon:yes stop_codon:yes gene_type:complete
MKKKLITLIYPPSFDGRKIYRKFIDNKKYKIIGFVDSMIENKRLYKKKIFHISKIKNIYFDQILTGGRYHKSIIKKLNTYKIPNNKIKLLPKRDFDFSKKELSLREKSIKRILNLLLNILNKNQIWFSFEASSLLAIIRRVPLGKFSDVDILLNKFFSNLLIKNLSKNKNLKIKKKFLIYNNKRILYKIHLSSKIKKIYEEPVVIDIDLISRDKKGFYKYFLGKKIYLNNCFNELIAKKYNQNKIYIPCRYQKYLKSLYGKNWLIPDDFFTVKDF